MNPLVLLNHEQTVCKICDFGESCIFDSSKPNSIIGETGSPSYQAIEIWNTKDKKNMYSYKVDMWSFGVLLWVLYSGNDVCPLLPSNQLQHRSSEYFYPQTVLLHLAGQHSRFS